MPAILLVFFFSGAASLTYEVVWMRQLALVFGATTYAVATILAVFMGGLALGSWVFGRWSDRLEKPLVVYALIEVAIGIYALQISDLFELLRDPYVALYQLDLPRSLLVPARGLLAGLVLLPPTFLMGGTLPLLADFAIRLRGDVGRQTSLLYFVNTAGAVSGCVLAGFYLVENHGISGSIRIAATLNGLLSVAAFALNARAPRRAAASGPDQPANEAMSTSASVARLAMISIAISGFTSLAYESLWTRALLRYLYNSTYAFTTMLAVFLAGIALGSWIYLALPYRKSHPARLFAVLELVVGLGFVASARLFESLAEIIQQLAGRRVESFANTVEQLAAGSMLILFLPALCLGATLPLATEICARNVAAVGRAIGRVYAVNTVGAILGTLVLTFVLIPTIGMQGSLLLLVSTNLALAALLWNADRVPSTSHAPAAVAFAVCVAIAFVAMPADLFRRTFSRSGIIFYHEGATDTVGVVQSANGQRIIAYQDRRGTAGTMTYPTNYLLGHFPFLLHRGEPKLGLHICFGVGNSLSAMTRHDSIERIDSVELSPHVLDAADLFWTNDGVIEHPKVRTIIDDGRNFTMAVDETYDVIELEPPEAFTAGVINLYTVEFYRDVAAHLRDDGVFVQWLPLGQAPLEEEKMLFRAFLDAFPHGTLWQQLEHGPFLMVGTKGPLRIDYAKLVERFRKPLVRRDLAIANIRDADDFLRLFVLGPERLAEIVAGVEPTHDDRTVLDFSMPRFQGSGFGFGTFTNVVVDGKIPLTINQERNAHYWRLRTPVSAHLVDTGGPADLVQQRVDARPLPAVPGLWTAPMSEADWKRWATRDG